MTHLLFKFRQFRTRVLYYPANARAALLTGLIGLKALTYPQLAKAKALGLSIKISP